MRFTARVVRVLIQNGRRASTVTAATTVTAAPATSALTTSGSTAASRAAATAEGGEQVSPRARPAAAPAGLERTQPRRPGTTRSHHGEPRRPPRAARRPKSSPPAAATRSARGRAGPASRGRRTIRSTASTVIVPITAPTIPPRSNLSLSPMPSRCQRPPATAKAQMMGTDLPPACSAAPTSTSSSS
jgi:hypothetical protein